DILLNPLSSKVTGIESVPGRHRFFADEGLILVQQIEARSVDPQKSPERHIVRVAASFKRLVQAQPFRIALPPIDLVKIAASIDQLSDHLDFFGSHAL